MPPYAAVVLGSTGNVGLQIVNLLVASDTVSQVIAVTRRPTGAFKNMPKVRELVLPDMNALGEAVAHAAREAGATVSFCAMGVGQGSRKMPEAEVRKIEVQYPSAFAEGCKAGGVLAMGLLTAAGADIKSSFKYVRIIGEKETAVIAVGIPSLSVYKPSVILGNSNTPSYLNFVFPFLEWMLPSRFHAIHKNDLARAMVGGTQNALTNLQRNQSAVIAPRPPVVKLYEYDSMRPFFAARLP